MARASDNKRTIGQFRLKAPHKQSQFKENGKEAGMLFP
jgi:hypothetical protein